MTQTTKLTRSEWIQQQLQIEGIFLSKEEIKDILNGNYEPYDPVASDIVFELDKEWGED